MNRRRLLAMLPLAPVAALVSAVQPAEAASEPIDTRVSYRLSDYVMFRPADGSTLCRACNGHHEYWTHGCQPTAFRRQMLFGIEGQMVPATPDAVPEPYVSGLCAFNRGGALTAPHQHNDFRWEDA